MWKKTGKLLWNYVFNVRCGLAEAEVDDDFGVRKGDHAHREIKLGAKNTKAEITFLRPQQRIAN